LSDLIQSDNRPSKDQPVLVTGGAGFIGSNFVLDWLEQEGTPVVNVDALTYAGNLENLEKVANDKRHVFVQADITDRSRMGELLEHYSPRALVHFAAESHVDRSIHGPGAFVETNIKGTFHLLEATRHYLAQRSGRMTEDFRFLHVSTDEVYGSLSPDAPAFQETTPYAPNSPYAASKAASDMLVRAWHHTYGLPTIITNCSNNYGPFQFPEKLIPLVVAQALAGDPLPVYGDGQQVRDWLHVRDHTAAIRRVLAAGRPGETYNIGGDNQTTNLEVVHSICALLDELLPDSPHRPHDRLIRFVEDRPGHDRRYAILADKIKRELGWRPAYTFAAGLRQTVQWYLANQDWVQGVRTGAYRVWLEKNYDSRRSVMQAVGRESVSRTEGHG
jgi:dTDP-glucose 4,6-dehydratase